MLAHVIINYDFKMAEDATSKNRDQFNELTMTPEADAKMLFRRRMDVQGV